jgi:transcriptional regulator with XRE-family HTH domain
MIIGDRLREMREEKKLSQGDIEKRIELLRCHISRVENGHTVPAIETLKKLARALEVPLYQLFYEGDEPPKLPMRLVGDDLVLSFDRVVTQCEPSIHSLLFWPNTRVTLTLNQPTRQGTEEEKAFVPLSPHRIPSVLPSPLSLDRSART